MVLGRTGECTAAESRYISNALRIVVLHNLQHRIPPDVLLNAATRLLMYEETGAGPRELEEEIRKYLEQLPVDELEDLSDSCLRPSTDATSKEGIVQHICSNLFDRHKKSTTEVPGVGSKSPKATRQSRSKVTEQANKFADLEDMRYKFLVQAKSKAAKQKSARTEIRFFEFLRLHGWHTEHGLSDQDINECCLYVQSDVWKGASLV